MRRRGWRVGGRLRWLRVERQAVMGWLRRSGGRITTRCGSEVIEQLNEALLAKAGEAKLLRVGKVRADTTVVSANVERPTDSGLLVTAIGG